MELSQEQLEEFYENIIFTELLNGSKHADLPTILEEKYQLSFEEIPSQIKKILKEMDGTVSFIMGQLMKSFNNRADPKIARKIIIEELRKLVRE